MLFRPLFYLPLHFFEDQLKSYSCRRIFLGTFRAWTLLAPYPNDETENLKSVIDKYRQTIYCPSFFKFSFLWSSQERCWCCSAFLCSLHASRILLNGSLNAHEVRKSYIYIKKVKNLMLEKSYTVDIKICLRDMRKLQNMDISARAVFLC